MASASASHSPTARVCGRRSASIPQASRAATTRSPGIGSCRTRTLWSILRRSRKPAWTMRQRWSSAVGVQPVVEGVRLAGPARRTPPRARARTRRAARGTPPGQRAWYWTKTERYLMPPGRRCDPLRDLALDHQHQALGAGRRPSSRCRIGLVMWYGRLATTSYGGGTRLTSPGPGRRPRPGGAPRPRPRAANRSRSTEASPRSSSTAVTCAPAASSPPVRNPRPGPISRTPRPGTGVRLAEDPLEHVHVGEEVLRQVVTGAQPGLARSAGRQRVEPSAARPRRRPPPLTGRPA